MVIDHISTHCHYNDNIKDDLISVLYCFPYIFRFVFQLVARFQLFARTRNQDEARVREENKCEKRSLSGHLQIEREKEKTRMRLINEAGKEEEGESVGQLRHTDDVRRMCVACVSSGKYKINFIFGCFCLFGCHIEEETSIKKVKTHR